MLRITSPKFHLPLGRLTFPMLINVFYTNRCFNLKKILIFEFTVVKVLNLESRIKTLKFRVKLILASRIFRPKSAVHGFLLRKNSFWNHIVKVPFRTLLFLISVKSFISVSTSSVKIPSFSLSDGPDLNEGLVVSESAKIISVSRTIKI